MRHEIHAVAKQHVQGLKKAGVEAIQQHGARSVGHLVDLYAPRAYGSQVAAVAAVAALPAVAAHSPVAARSSRGAASSSAGSFCAFNANCASDANLRASDLRASDWPRRSHSVAKRATAKRPHAMPATPAPAGHLPVCRAD